MNSHLAPVVCTVVTQPAASAVCCQACCPDLDGSWAYMPVVPARSMLRHLSFKFTTVRF